MLEPETSPIQQARRSLLDQTDPTREGVAAVRRWVDTMPRGSEFSLEDAVEAVRNQAPTGGVSLALGQLGEEGKVTEHFRVSSSDGEPKAVYDSILDIPMELLSLKSNAMVVPIYRVI